MCWCRSTTESGTCGKKSCFKYCGPDNNDPLPTLRDATHQAILNERERCAKICDELAAEYKKNGTGSYLHMSDAAENCAIEIRGDNVILNDR